MGNIIPPLTTQLRLSLFIVICLSLLSACAIVVPQQTGGRIVRSQSNSEWCNFPGVTLDRTPGAPIVLPSANGQVVFGLANVYYPGADPAPCWRVKSTQQFALVKWDVNHRIVEANIEAGYRFERAEIVLFNNSTRSSFDDVFRSPLAEVLLATEPWTAGAMFGGRDEPIRVATAPLPGGPWQLNSYPEHWWRDDSRDVTDLVRSWREGRIPNHGLVIVPSNVGIGEHQTRIRLRDTGIKLVMHFTPPP